MEKWIVPISSSYVTSFCFKPNKPEMRGVAEKDLGKDSLSFIKTTAPASRLIIPSALIHVSMTQVAWAWISGWTRISVIWTLTREKPVRPVTWKRLPATWEWPDIQVNGREKQSFGI